MVIFDRLSKTLQFLKRTHGGYSRSYFKLIFYAVACDACKYITSCILHQNNSIFDSLKDRLYTKILSQFSKLQDEKPFVGPFFIA